MGYYKFFCEGHQNVALNHISEVNSFYKSIDKSKIINFLNSYICLNSNCTMGILTPAFFSDKGY